MQAQRVESRTRRGPRTAVTVVLALVLGLLAPLAGVQPRAEAGLSNPQITLGPDGIDRGEAWEVVRRDTDYVWANESGGPLELTSPNGVLDSGVIPDGGAFVASLDHPGTYIWQTEVASGVVVVESELPATDELAVDVIPDLAFPPRPEGDVITHPDTTAPVSGSRLLVGFTDTATAEEARSALAGARVGMIGGLPELGVVLVRPDITGAFFRVQNALDDLRQDPAVEFATAEFIVQEATVPAPTSTFDDGPFTWQWDSTEDAPFGTDNNWSMEISRVPGAWNLNEAIAARGDTPAGIAVVDSGFEAHEDLSRLERIQLCRDGLNTSNLGNFEVSLRSCTTTNPTDHGNHVAGIVGADHDNRTPDGDSIGVTGVDPFSTMYGVTRTWDAAIGASFGEGSIDGALAQTFEELLVAAKDGRVRDLRVINSSNRLLGPDFGTDWPARWAGETCGPGPDDDDTGTGPCLPHTEDGTIAEHAAFGRLSRRAAERLVAELPTPPLIVAAAGNGSDTLCLPLGTSCPEGTPREVLPATIESSLAWAGANWRPGAGPNPIVVVESFGAFENDVLTPSTRRSPFSDIGGDIAAPGLALSTDSSELGDGGVRCEVPGSDGYCFLLGTSQAAPFVAGAAGLLLAWDPSLTMPQLRSLLLDWTVDDTIDQAAPRIDVFRSMQSLDGAARAMVDVNDPSRDGNRRVVRDGEGNQTLDTTSSDDPDGLTQRDGFVDMRDFRRFRDAWLAECLLDGDAGCPDDILLDGPDDHPKNDLNGDGCIRWAAPSLERGLRCPSETVFNRFDFNGDGIVSRTATAPVGIRADGAPAQGPVDGATMTDLEVLASQWDGGTPGAEGIASSDLDALLESGDIELHLDGINATGATEATIDVVDESGGTPTSLRALLVPLDGTERILTVPAGTPVSLRISAEGSDGTVAARTPTVTLDSGEDRRIDACGDVALDLDRTALPPGSTATVEVQVATCGPSVEGITVDLGVESALTDAPVVEPARVTTDAAGRATAVLTAGDEEGPAQVSATASVPTAIDGSASAIRSDRVDVYVGRSYDLEPVALEDPGSDWVLLDRDAADAGRVQPVRPSINAAGDVAFTGAIAGTPHDDLFVVEGGASLDPTDPTLADRRSGTEVLDGTSPDWSPQINDDGVVVVAWSRFDDPEVTSEVRRYEADGSTDVVVEARTDLLSNSPEPYTLLDHPTINNNGTVVVRGSRSADGVDVLVQSQLVGVTEGAPIPFARPWHADDGTTVTTAASDSGLTDARGLPILDTLVLAGDGDHDAGSVVLARTDAVAGSRWASIGSATVSDSGDVAVFVGDDGSGPGLQVAVRGATGAWSEPVTAAGGTLPPQLGSASLTDVSGRPGVVHVPRSPAGPAGDRLLLAFQATPDANAAEFTATPGVWTVAADIAVDGGGAIELDLDRPVPVLQEGTELAGSTVVEHVLHDPIARDADGADDDHRLAIGVELADGRLGVVRATWLGVRGAGTLVAAAADISLAPPPVPPATTMLAAAKAPAVPLTLAAAAPTGPDDVEVLAGPHVAAFTLADVDVLRGGSYQLTNRSRLLDGTPVWAVEDGGPNALAPDASTTGTAPSDTSSLRLRLGTPVGPSPDTSEVALQVFLAPGANQPPTADAGGPYEVGIGVTLRLDSGGTTDDGTPTKTWDLDGDGTFETSQGRFDDILEVLPSDVEALVCGGTCVVGDTHDVTLQVSDGEFTGEATAQVTIVGEQGVDALVRPSVLKIEPGRSSTAWLELDPVNGFAGLAQVALEGLPADWSSSFADEAPVPSTVGVRISVPLDAADGVYPMELVVTAAGTEQRVPLEVSTVFGLLPECDATVSGTALDADTGEPLPGFVSVDRSSTRIDEVDGTWSRTFTLPEGVEVDRIGVSWNGTGYAPFEQSILVACDDDLTVEVTASAYDRAGVTGRVVEGLYNPISESRPAPTDTPIAGVAVEVEDLEETTGPDGRFTTPQELEVFDPTAPRSVSVTASADGYWPTTIRSQVGAGQTVDVGDIGLLAKCSAIVGEVDVVDQFGDPVQGSTVQLRGDTFREQVTDGDGRVTFDVEEPLGTYNRERRIMVIADPPADPSWDGAARAEGDVVLSSCGGRSDTLEVVLQRPDVPEPTFGDLSGTVTDRETGLPLTSGGVQLETRRSVLEPWSRVGSASIGPDGTWSAADVPVGDDGEGSVLLRVQVSSSGYWPDFVQSTLVADQSTVVDADLLLVRYGAITGTVTDRETGEPLGDVPVRYTVNGFPVTVRTGDGGGYRIDRLPLTDGTNDPKAYELQAVSAFDPVTRERTHWQSERVRPTVRADVITVQDFTLLPVCPGGSVSGVVVDATTLDPIEGAFVIAQGVSDLTDVDGRYRLEGIEVDEQNVANQVTVQASKEGFFDASRRITIFCESETTLDFGTPVGGFGSVTGTVTGPDGPLEGVFVGSAWGWADTTGPDGTYLLERAPLGSDGEPRDWTVTARRNGAQQQELVAVTSGDPVVQDFTFGADNRAPVATAQSLSTTEDTSVPITLGGTDDDGDPLTFAVVDPPASGTLQGDAPALTYVPAPGFTGLDSLTFTADDGLATSEPATISIEVTPDQDRPPVLSVQPTTTVAAGGSIEVPVAADDPDGDPVTLSLDGAPSWVDLTDDGGGIGTITAAPDRDVPAGTTNVQVTATAGGAEETATMAVTVTAAVNRPPSVTVAPVPVAGEGDTIVLDASGTTDLDGDDLSFTWSVPGRPTLTGPRVELPTVDDLAVTVTLTVDDGVGGVVARELLVRADNLAPTVLVDEVVPGDGPAVVPGRGAGATPVEVLVGEQLSLTGSWTDPGSADSHTWSVDFGDGTIVTGASAALAASATGVQPATAVTGGATTAALAATSPTSLTATHTFIAAGTPVVTVEVCDDDGGCGTAQVPLLVRAVVPPPDDPEPDVGDEPTTVLGRDQDATSDDGATADPVVRDGTNRPEDLASTGAPTRDLFLFALVLVMAGAVLTRARRRPRRPG